MVAIRQNPNRHRAAATAAAAVLFFLLTSLGASAQALSVLPVNIFLAPGQKASSMTVTNQGTSETAIQIRAYAWNQPEGIDKLTASDLIVASPPLVRMAPGATQVIRLILRQPPKGREDTYRILIDQIPPPAQPGVVNMVLRMSIPIFALPAVRAEPHVVFHLELDAGKLFLVAVNDGLRHEVIRDIELTTSDGRKLKPEASGLPYILAGVTRRWAIAAQGALPPANETMRLTAHADAGKIDQQVRVAGLP